MTVNTTAAANPYATNQEIVIDWRPLSLDMELRGWSNQFADRALEFGEKGYLTTAELCADAADRFAAAALRLKHIRQTVNEAIGPGWEIAHD